VDPLDVGRLAAGVGGLLTPELSYSDWTVENRNYFRAIRIEKTMMTVLLLMIVAVAAFNIVASLVMLVTDKERDIAILRTYGLEPKRVARIFMLQGSAIGAVGTMAGVALGLMLAFNVESIVPWLEATFNFQIMPGDVYYVTEIPSEVQWLDVVVTPTLALLVSMLATLYPARRAAAIAPAEALRYE
jgi:lipoprotein-releasing system permease protein